MSRKRLKQYLMLLLAIGVIAIAASGGGTFASFSAQTANSGNTFATGTLVLQNTASATTCLSTGGGNTNSNVNGACAKAINVNLQEPGQSTTGTVDLKNVGSLNGSTLTFTPSACTPSDVGTETYHGTGDPCGVLDVYVQEVDGSNNPISCLYGGGTATTCAFSDTKTLTALAASGAASLGALNAGATRHFVVGLELQSGAGNQYQGRQASFDMTWNLGQ